MASSETEGYGEKRPVRTIGEAQSRIEAFFSSRKQSVRIGEIIEKELFFEAVIRDMSGNIVDRVIIDKRTGRIRSIY